MTSLRLLLLCAHVLRGALTLLLLFPWLPHPVRARRIRRWSATLLAIVKVRVHCQGRPPEPGRGALIVANHVSWLDIAVLHSQVSCHFISKSEVARWPLIGWMARQLDTLFLARARQRDAVRINREITEKLADGAILALFPEGTTSDGRGLGSFYAALFEPAVRAGVPVFPATLRYRDVHGRFTEAAAYHGDMSVWRSLRSILAHAPLRADLHFSSPLDTAAGDRRLMAKAAEAAIRGRLSDDVAGKSP